MRGAHIDVEQFSVKINLYLELDFWMVGEWEHIYIHK